MALMEKGERERDRERERELASREQLDANSSRDGKRTAKSRA